MKGKVNNKGNAKKCFCVNAGRTHICSKEKQVGDTIVWTLVVRIFAAPEEAEMQVCRRTWCNQRQGRWASSFELGRQRKSLWPRSKPPVSIFATLLPTSSRPTNGKQRRTSSKKQTSSHPTTVEVSCFIFQKTRHPHLLIFSCFSMSASSAFILWYPSFFDCEALWTTCPLALTTDLKLKSYQ